MEKISENHSASKEDYLETIYDLSLNNKNFKAVDIAKRLGISRASVSEALKKLAEQGFLNYEKYKSVTLTNQGLELAKKVFLKHKTLCKFFEKFLGLSNNEAQINACKIEHVITENAFNKIKKLVEDI